jgi:hypothetical protein
MLEASLRTVLGHQALDFQIVDLSRDSAGQGVAGRITLSRSNGPLLALAGGVMAW